MSSNPRQFREPGFTGASLDERLQRAAAAFPYPQTPDLAAQEQLRLRDAVGREDRRKRSQVIGWALVILLLFLGLLASPVRARVLDWIRIGAVRIFFIQPTPAATLPLPSGTPSPEVSLTPTITPTFLSSVLDLGGETSLSQAQAQSPFSLQVPAYPPDLGVPQHVYLQDFGGPVVILVWMDKDHPSQVRMSLSETSSDQYIFEKYLSNSMQDTQVDGHAAVWVDGNYILTMRNGDTTLTRLVNQSHTLIWNTGKMTFRMETDVDLATAVRIAQSIH